LGLIEGNRFYYITRPSVWSDDMCPILVEI
jgi:hypothetical protein